MKTNLDYEIRIVRSTSEKKTLIKTFNVSSRDLEVRNTGLATLLKSPAAYGELIGAEILADLAKLAALKTHLAELNATHEDIEESKL